jgi:hypothetical protein
VGEADRSILCKKARFMVVNSLNQHITIPPHFPSGVKRGSMLVRPDPALSRDRPIIWCVNLPHLWIYKSHVPSKPIPPSNDAPSPSVTARRFHLLRSNGSKILVTATADAANTLVFPIPRNEFRTTCGVWPWCGVNSYACHWVDVLTILSRTDMLVNVDSSHTTAATTAGQ